jgi:hypothetical protein
MSDSPFDSQALRLAVYAAAFIEKLDYAYRMGKCGDSAYDFANELSIKVADGAAAAIKRYQEKEPGNDQ